MASIEDQSVRPVEAADTANTNVRAMLVAISLFFMWGFLTSLNDTLIPNLKAIFALSYTRVMLVQFSFFSSYFVFALPAGKLIDRVGYKKTMITGLITMMVGALLFIPASRVPSFGFFLTALVVLAAGITSLQVAANPYVVNLGPPATASSRLNLAQGFNSLGTLLAPLFGGYVILSHLSSGSGNGLVVRGALQSMRLAEARSVQLPYLGMALTLAVLVVALARVRLPAMTHTQDLRPGSSAPGKADTLRQHPQLFMGVLGIFLYVGAEVAIGSFLISYFELPGIGNLSARNASFYVSLYWAGSMVGRFVGSALLHRVRTGRALGIAAVAASLLVLTSVMTSGHIAMFSITAVGLFNSIMFPSIFTLGLSGLGPLTSKGSSLMVAASIGGALIPLLQGRLADSSLGLHHAFALPILCYIYIAVFGFTRPVTA